MFQHAQNEAKNLNSVKNSSKFSGLGSCVYSTLFGTLVRLWSGRSTFKSQAGQIGDSVANGSPPLRRFFERSWVVSRRNDTEIGPANSLQASYTRYTLRNTVRKTQDLVGNFSFMNLLFALPVHEIKNFSSIIHFFQIWVFEIENLNKLYRIYFSLKVIIYCKLLNTTPKFLDRLAYTIWCSNVCVTTFKQFVVDLLSLKKYVKWAILRNEWSQFWHTFHHRWAS